MAACTSQVKATVLEKWCVCLIMGTVLIFLFGSILGKIDKDDLL